MGQTYLKAQAAYNSQVELKKLHSVAQNLVSGGYKHDDLGPDWAAKLKVVEPGMAEKSQAQD